MPNKEDTISLDTMSNTNISDLYDAAKNGNLDTVQALIDSGADVNQADEHGKTALHYAAASCNNDVLELLIARGVNVNQADNDGRLAIHYSRGNSKGLDLLIPQISAELINHADKDGMTVLHLTAASGRLDLVEVLIERGADLNQPNNNGDTDLHYASLNVNIEVLEYLIDKKGVDVNPLEVQKVGAKVYEVLKATKNDGNLVEGYKNSLKFSGIVNYGEENVFRDAHEKIQQFCRELDYKTLSEQTYGGLFRNHNNKYKINKDKAVYGIDPDHLEVDITPQNIMDLSLDIDLVANNTDHDIAMSGVDADNNQDSSI